MLALTFPPKTRPVVMRVFRSKGKKGGLETGHQKYTDEQVINILREGEAGGKIMLLPIKTGQRLTE